MKVMVRLLIVLLLGVSHLAMAREIPIEDLFREGNFKSVQISPDGQHMAVVIPQADRSVMAVLRISDMQVVGKWDYGEDRHFEDVLWVNDKRLFYWVAFKLGRYDFKVGKGDLYASNIDGTGRIDIPNGATYNIIDVTPDDPNTILVQRSVESAFLFKMNVNTGALITVATAPLDSGGFLVDHNQKVRYASGVMDDLTRITLRRDGDRWTEIHRAADTDDIYSPIAFAEDNKRVYFFKSEKGNPGRVVLIDPETNAETDVSSNPNVSPSDLVWSSDDKTLLAVRYDDGLPSWEFVNKTHPEAKVLAGLIKAFPDKAVGFGGTSRDGRYFLISTYSDIDPGQVYLFDAKEGSAKYLLSSMPWLKSEELSSMQPISYRTRDGATVHGYLTTPRGKQAKNLPLIINPHGGPHGIRDSWSYNEEAQLFANRGYAVLQVNYRGSGGYGQAFQTAGYKKWGTLMQDDLTDAVRWAISQGVADPNRVCIYGASYGGYAALMSAVREPDLYKCTVGYVGVYDLDIQRNDSDTADSESGRSYLRAVQPDTAAERQMQSPAYGTDRIKAGILLVHGAKDVRVPIKHMNFLVSQLAKSGKKPDEIIVEKKEQHGFVNLQNNVNLYTKMLAFFDKYIGPKAQPAAAQ